MSSPEPSTLAPETFDALLRRAALRPDSLSAEEWRRVWSEAPTPDPCLSLRERSTLLTDRLIAVRLDHEARR